MTLRLSRIARHLPRLDWPAWRRISGHPGRSSVILTLAVVVTTAGAGVWTQPNAMPSEETRPHAERDLAAADAERNQRGVLAKGRDTYAATLHDISRPEIVQLAALEREKVELPPQAPRAETERREAWVTRLWIGSLLLAGLLGLGAWGVRARRPAATAMRRHAPGQPARAGTAPEAEGSAQADALRETMATLDLGTFMARDSDGTIRYWSQGCERFYGWTAEEALGRISHDLLQTRFPVPLAEIEAALERDGEWTGDLHHRTKDGRAMVVTAHKALRRDQHGRATGLMEAITDVTAQREAEAALSRHAGHQAVLLGVSRAIMATNLGEAALASLVFESVASAADVDILFNYALDADGRALRLVAAPGLGPERVEALLGLRVDDSLCGLAAETRHAVTADASRIARDERAAFVRSLGITAYASHPLTGSDGTILGTLSFASTSRDRFTGEHVDLFQAISHLLALAWQRRQAEAQLHGSEAFLRSVLEASTDGVCVIEPDGALSFMNDSGRRQMEIGDVAAVKGRDWATLWPDSSRQRVRAAVAAALAGEEARFEAVQTAARGATRWCDAVVAPVRDDAGQVARLVAVTRDITDSKAAERALAESSERLRLALDAGRMGLWSWDLASDQLQWDERLFELFGMDPAAGQPSGEAALSRVHPEDRASLEAAIGASLASGDGMFDCEFRVILENGATRWIGGYGRAVPGPDGRAARMVGLNFDVTERRAAEAERDQAAGLLRAFADAVPGVIYAKDREGRLLIANAGTAALIGKAPDAFLGRTDAEFLDDPAQAAAVMANDRRIMESGVAEQVEEQVSLADGTPATWLSTKAPFRDASGRIIGLIGASVDITARKEAEAVLARGRAELELLVAERTRDLERTQQQLAHAQRMEALGQLAGGIAHDFNNVLQAVQGGVALIEKRASAEGDIRRLARMVSDASTRGSSITRRLLAFSRRGELRAEPVDPVALLTDMREIFAHTLGAGVAVQVRTEPGLPLLLADKAQLETVLVNLAANARDAMPGGGTLTLSAGLDVVDRDGAWPTPASVVASPLKVGCYVRLSLSDTGEGMVPAVLARATEPFFTTKAHGKGTGLGLAMARGFAEQSGGSLAIESAPGQGARVTLWFPVTAMAAVAAPAKAEAEPPAIGRRRRARLLLVDDDGVVRDVTAEGLQAEGFSVLSVESGVAALALLDAGERVDLVVSDLSMPGMDGLALIREAQKRRPGLPSILLTGFATNAAELAVGGALSGSFSLLRKPATSEQITERVEMLLEAATAAADDRTRRPR